VQVPSPQLALTPTLASFELLNQKPRKSLSSSSSLAFFDLVGVKLNVKSMLMPSVSAFGSV